MNARGECEAVLALPVVAQYESKHNTGSTRRSKRGLGNLHFVPEDQLSRDTFLQALWHSIDFLRGYRSIRKHFCRG